MSNYLKSLSQEAKDLMDEIEDANSDIDYNKLFFIGSNKEKTLTFLVRHSIFFQIFLMVKLH